MWNSIKHYRAAWVTLLLSAVAIVLQAEYTSWDIQLADHYFDFKAHLFPLKHDWLYQDFLHGMVKQALIALDIGILLLILLDWLNWLPLNRWSSLRLRFVFLASLFISVIIASLKAQSNAHCPWDIDRYAGEAPLQPLFTALFSDTPAVQAGHCFPAGHASTGLWLAAFCVFYLPASPKKALGLFIAGLSMGLLLGWAQQVRGAHFLSHTLTSAWIASAIILSMLTLLDRKLLAPND